MSVSSVSVERRLLYYTLGSLFYSSLYVYFSFPALNGIMNPFRAFGPMAVWVATRQSEADSISVTIVCSVVFLN